MVWYGVAWRGVAWRGVAWRGVVWCVVVWCGVVWCGVVWCGVVWCGVVWCGVVWCGVVWCGVLSQGMVNDHGLQEPGPNPSLVSGVRVRGTENEAACFKPSVSCVGFELSTGHAVAPHPPPSLEGLPSVGLHPVATRPALVVKLPPNTP